MSFAIFMHHFVAHPLRWLTGDSRWVMKLHDETARRAWPEEFELEKAQERALDRLRRAVDALDKDKELLRKRTTIDDQARAGRMSDLQLSLDRKAQERLRDVEFAARQVIAICRKEEEESL